MYELKVVNGTLITDGYSRRADLAIDGGVVVEVADIGSLGPTRTEINAEGLLVLPGAVDVHFHCRAPSPPERGTFHSETVAAAAGGVTTVFEMPISSPPCSRPEVLRSRRELAESESVIDFALYAGGAFGGITSADELVEAGAIAFKLFTHEPPAHRAEDFGGLWAADEASIYCALEAIEPTGLVCTIHPENQSLIKMYESRARGEEAVSRPPVVEATAVALASAMSLDIGTQVHFAHVSSALAVDAIRAARSVGAGVTGETTPHYLSFTEEEISEFGSFVKVAPPLRSMFDQESLWKALREDSLQMVASDHAPFTPEEKRLAPFALAGQGMPAVETMVPVVLDRALRGELSLERCVELVAEAPARRFGIYPKKGTIQPGSDADIVLWDPTSEKILSAELFLSKAGGCGVAYDGMRLKGLLRTTMVRGRVVFDSGMVNETNWGEFVVPLGN